MRKRDEPVEWTWSGNAAVVGIAASGGHLRRQRLADSSWRYSAAGTAPASPAHPPQPRISVAPFGPNSPHPWQFCCPFGCYRTRAASFESRSWGCVQLHAKLKDYKITTNSIKQALNNWKQWAEKY